MEPIRLVSSRRARERNLRDRQMRLFLASALFFSVLVSGYALIRYGSIFKITGIRVLGLQDESNTREVVEYLTEKFEGGAAARFLGSNNIFAWPRSGALHTTDLPFLSTVSFSRKLFSRRIDVETTPREKFGIWCSHSDKTSCFWFDITEGVLLEETPTPEGTIIPVISENSERGRVLGEQVLDAEHLSRLAIVFAFIEDPLFSAKSVAFDQSLDELRIVLVKGPSVRVSLRFDPRSNLTAMGEFLKNKSSKTVKSIDLTVENKLYWTAS